jgi:YCII-related domain-containing protein
MKYLCLAYEKEEKLDALSRSEWDALRGETLTYVEALRKSGHLIVTQALQSARTGATVRVRSGKLSVTDGPFAETKEQTGRLLPDRRQGPERSHPGGVTMAVGTPWEHRGAADRGAQAGQALRIITTGGDVRCVQHA